VILPYKFECFFLEAVVNCAGIILSVLVPSSIAAYWNAGLRVAVLVYPYHAAVSITYSSVTNSYQLILLVYHGCT